jgi:hypothetical protein
MFGPIKIDWHKDCSFLSAHKIAFNYEYFSVTKRAYADWANAIEQGVIFGAFSSIVTTYASACLLKHNAD